MRTYDLKNVICTIATVAISGYGETDAISYEWAEDITTKTVTADGDVIHSRNNNKSATVTITLSQTSRAHLFLEGLLDAQHGESIGIGPPAILPLPFFLLDPATGETLRSEFSVFTKRPVSNKGKTVGDVVYTVDLPKAKRTPAIRNVT